MKPEISIVIPAYNEEESLPALFESLYPVMRDMGRPFEIIFINDGSKDSTLAILYDLYLIEVRVIDLNGNFGQHMAIMAGFERRGEIVITLDADLRTRRRSPNIVAKMDEGHDCRNIQKGKTGSAVQESGFQNGQQDHQQDHEAEYTRLRLHAQRIQQEDS